VAAGRAAAGAGRRAGLGVVSFGAVTVTSGSVTAACPQADPDEAHKPGSGKAPQATAAKSRRFQTGSRDELRLIAPHAPNITRAKISPRGILSSFSPTVSGCFGKTNGNIWQCGRRDTQCADEYWHPRQAQRRGSLSQNSFAERVTGSGPRRRSTSCNARLGRSSWAIAGKERHSAPCSDRAAQ
jgi:hypothetical protein